MNVLNMNSSQQPQFTPQMGPNQNYYQQQQQLMKPNHVASPATQFLGSRLTGLQQVAGQQQFSSQQNSPQTHSQAPLESLYNGASMQRAAPIYAPKPTYYSQQQHHNLSQSMYQTAPARPIQQPFYPQQQQHSPRAPQLAGPMQLQQQLSGLSVRHLPNGLLGPPAHQLNLSPGQSSEQQMQQLFMSYQQQQQQQMNPNELMQQQQHQSAMMALGQESQVDAGWPLQPDDRLHQLGNPHRPQPATRSQRVASDRDSVSTLSRANQLDDRRSFTMRSQYTNHASQAARYSRKFTFLRLTGEALKRILGLAGDQQLLESGDRMQRNLSLANPAHGSGNNKNLPFAQASQAHAEPKVTAIDSGEDHYFRRKVFSYQLIIQRLLNLICAALVLLSPVAMLLLPKMESVLRSSPDPLAESGSSGEPSAHSASSITHAVGLQQAQRQQQQSYLAPQAQWRISECSSECDGPLIGFVARLIMLLAAYWAVFARPQTASLPRIDFHRCLLSSAALLLSLAYWLFFLFRIFDKRFNDFELQYSTIVQFALSLLESLILLHYLAVILLEIRHRKKVYCLKVVRSPDGASQYYSCGSLSIQKCAHLVLEKYHRNFKHFGPHAEQLLALEDQLAQVYVTGSSELGGGGDSAPVRPTRRSTSRASRHRSRRRSSSGSPASRSGSRRRSGEREVKLYQLDLNPPEQQAAPHDPEKPESNTKATENNKHENDSNSADQSSDATSRMKESSLETIKAANSSSELLGQQQQQQRAKKQREDQQQAQSGRDDTESVRSVRSRRSTGRRSQHRHREHRESRRPHRSSSRLDVQADEGEGEWRHRHHSSTIEMGADPVEEHERKLRRRKLRLLAAVQESFAQIKQIDEASTASHNNRQQQPPALDASGMQQLAPAKQALGPNQAARSLYPSIARTLQKYLRLSRQTGRHNLQSIYEHLSKCLLYRLSARTFLEKFLNQDPVWQQSETNLFADCKLADSLLMCPAQESRLELNSWSLVCDTLLSRQIRSGTFFVLRQGQVSLLVTVAKMPHLNLREEIMDQKSCKFSLGPNSETSV